MQGRVMSGDLRDLIKTGKRFPVIYAEPPWTFETRTDKGKGRSAERHYVCMSLDDIKALPVRPLAAADCALFLWTTFPHLWQAHEVIEAWGFSYRTLGLIWVKQTRDRQRLAIGNGYWTRANSEPCLLAARRQEATQIGRRPFGHPGAGTRAFAQAGRNLRAHRGAARRSVSRTVRTKRAPKLDMLGQRGREVCSGRRALGLKLKGPTRARCTFSTFAAFTQCRTQKRKKCPRL
jgi:MT-A70